MGPYRGQGSRSRLRMLLGERSGRYGGGRDNENEENDDDGNIGDYDKDKDDGGGGMRGKNKCNVNFGSANSGMRRGGKGLLPIPAYFG